MFFKLDVSKAAVGAHTLEVEVRDPAVPATLLKGVAPLLVSRTVASGTQRAFSSACDKGTLTASLSAVTMDEELFRRVLARARGVAGTPPPASGPRPRPSAFASVSRPFFAVKRATSAR